MKFRLSLAVLWLVLVVDPLEAGVFLKADDPNRDPFIIVHPTGYDGNGGVVSIRVCAEDPWLVPALEKAIATWNDLVPSKGNCVGCVMAEDPSLPPPLPPVDLESVLLHELHGSLCR